MEWLAHSGRKSRGVPPQPYGKHVAAVVKGATDFMNAALHYSVAERGWLADSVRWAAAFHDLGKLEAENQRVLRTSERGGLPVNHVDAGTAHLMNLQREEEAVAVYGHHKGLCDFIDERRKAKLARQDASQAPFRDPAIKLATDQRLTELVRLHETLVPVKGELGAGKCRTGFERRLLLSCLVDADHSDTANNYGEAGHQKAPQSRWAERLASLDHYVADLGSRVGARTDFRKAVYGACRNASASTPMWSCDSPVGSGKTTAVMAYLLKVAQELQLRHVFVVLPYTNIVQQSVDVYRRALVLPGEDPSAVVAEHHHQAEFNNVDMRMLTTLWDAPIIVTTAVQFFETLGANQTARLRKLHQLPGSAVFIDEAHAAMRIELWPFMWAQLKNLSDEWTCRFVLASGSLAKFWTNGRIMGEAACDVPAMIPESIQRQGGTFEQSRVKYRSRTAALDLQGLCDWIGGFAGARLVVMNTVQSAAVVARELRRRGIDTLHLSTALAPIHRAPILRLVHRRLAMQPELSWVLVATSCVEAGVDFSFRTAFRERCRATSLVQIGGRVNRHAEGALGEVWDFVANDPQLTVHPEFNQSRIVVEDLFAKNRWETSDITSVMTYALEQEFKRQSGEEKIKSLFGSERQRRYPEVAKQTRLISSDTRLVVIDPQLADAIERGDRVDRRELLPRSVQIWSSKIGRLALPGIGWEGELYRWPYGYDPEFLGIMDGVLQQRQIDRDGFAIV